MSNYRPVTIGLDDFMTLERLDELANVCAHGFNVHAVGAANFIRDVCLIASLFEEFQNCGSDWIQAEHLAMKDVKDDASILALRMPNCVKDFWHRTNPMSRSRRRLDQQLFR
jgi:hypothetical protein